MASAGLLPRRKRSDLSATGRGILLGVCLSYLVSALLEGNYLQSSYKSIGLDSNRLLEEEDHGPPEEEKEIDATVEATSIVCIIILLIALTIGFEEIKELIVESSPRDFKPIVESLFGEMTVLGFLSVCTFCITKTPFPYVLSEQLFGEEEFLVEIFEMVHFSLFFIMIFFVAQVLVLLKESIKNQTKWLGMDRVYQEIKYGKKACHHHYDKDQFQLFSALNDEFILERSMEEPFEPAPLENRAPEDFNFGRYLSICLGITVSHVVHVDIVSWMCFIVLTIGFYVVMLVLDNNLVIIAWIWAALGWVTLAFILGFEKYLTSIAKTMAPPTPNQNGHAREHDTLLPHGSPPTPSIALPAWCNIDLDSYMSTRSSLKKKLCPKVPNRQETLFYMEKKGPHVHFLVLQINLVFLGIYGALLVLAFIPAILNERHKSWLLVVVYLVTALAPVVGILRRARHVVATMSVVGCIGSLRRPQVVSDVIRHEKTRLVVRAFLVLDKMRSLASDNEGDSPASSPKEPRQLTHLEVMEIGATFDIFDRNLDGKLSIEELDRVMQSLGGHTSQRKLERMLAALDVNGDGYVSKNEFLEWYRHNMMDASQHLSMHERAHALFHLFDANESGSISIGEFKKTLDAFHIGFTVDEVGQIIQELDEDGNIMISVEEFHELLEKYYPEELEGGEH